MHDIHGEKYTAQPGDLIILGNGGRGSQTGMVGLEHNTPTVYRPAGPPYMKCRRLNKITNGFQCHHLDDILALYGGPVYWLPLSHALYGLEQDRLNLLVNMALGTVPVKRPCCFGLFSFVFNKVAAILNDVGRLECQAANWWSPCKLTKYLVKHGIYKPPIRLIS